MTRTKCLSERKKKRQRLDAEYESRKSQINSEIKLQLLMLNEDEL
jgi:hypothetical protein